ncbi:MFS transporter [Actinopolymorpha sp. B9G3]|uniref:MFS transporter n=1 Tax=Actinopolymorpha sp. B9G3 TaxID=3158970 RepID=UPI0032D98C17
MDVRSCRPPQNLYFTNDRKLLSVGMAIQPDATYASNPTGRRCIVIVLICAAQAMLIVDVVVVNVALPSIRNGLAIPDDHLQLISVAYTLTFGSLLIAFGRAGDLLGRRRVFLLGLSLFTLASLFTGLAQNEWQLITARAGQGVGAAMVAPTALALLTTAFEEGARRNRALGYWAAVSSAGAIGGQLLGGLMTDTLGWRWIFLINVPVGVVTVIAGCFVFAESRDDRRPSLNLRGAVLLVLSLACGMLAITRFAEGGHKDEGTFLLVAAATALVAFIMVERRHNTPIFDPRLIRRANVVAANALLAVNAGMLGGTLFFTTLYLQLVLGYSPMEVGFAFAPITLLILIISPRAGALITRYGARLLVLIGFCLLAGGMLLLARVPTNGSYLRDVLPPLFLLAIGSGLSYAPTFAAGTAGVPNHDQGLASGLLNSAQELGTAVGVAVLGALAAASTVDTTVNSLAAGYRTGLLTAAGALVVSLLLIRQVPGTGESS